MHQRTLAIMAVIVLMAGIAPAATLNVPSDWPSIQQAMDHSSDGDNYSIADSSPCAPAHSSGCNLIGAFGVGCGAVSVTPVEWSTLKRMYR